VPAFDALVRLPRALMARRFICSRVAIRISHETIPPFSSTSLPISTDFCAVKAQVRFFGISMPRDGQTGGGFVTKVIGLGQRLHESLALKAASRQTLH
jgi:hypothetical protein